MASLIAKLQCLSAEQPESVALLDGVTTVSFKVMMQAVDRLAAHFREQGVSTLGIVGDNSIAWIIADLAARAAQLPCVPLPLFFSPQQQQYVIEEAAISHIVSAAGEQMGDESIETFNTGFGGVALAALADRPAVTSGAKLTFTSGSTGTPKGVVLSADSLDATTVAIVNALTPLNIEKHLCVLPLATLLENVAGVYASLIHGVAVYVSSMADIGMRGAADLDVFRFMGMLNKVQPSSLILVPQLLMALVSAAEMGLPVPTSLKFIAVGGGKVSASLLERAAKQNLPVFEGYGLSECGSVISLNLPGTSRPGSVGKPLSHAHIRIGEDQEILVSGAVMRGYLGEQTLTDNEIATGDIGYFDADGFLYVRGRKKNMFITSFGRNVNPEWVESELTQRLPIAQAAVYGEAMPANVAVITIRKGFNENQVQQAVDAVNATLPDYARVARIIYSCEPFTQTNGLATANGRIRRDTIYEAYRNRMQTLDSDSSKIKTLTNVG